MKKFFKPINLYFPYIFGLIIMFCFVKFYPGEITLSDESVKLKQIKDLIISDYKTIACHYPGKEIDPNFDFFPSKPPILRIIDKQCFYHFPFHYSFLLLPFYLLGNIKFIYILTSLFSFLTFLYTVKLGDLFFEKEDEKFLLRFFSSSSLGLFYYGFKLNDHIISTFFCLLAVYLLLSKEKMIWLIFSGGLFAIASFIRQETLLLGVLSLGGIFITRIKSTKDLISLGSGFTLVLIMGIGLNLFFFHEPFGLRGMEIKEKASIDFYDISYRFYLYLIGGGDRGHFKTFPLYILGLLYLIRYPYKERFSIFFLLLALPPLFVVPFLVKNDPFGQFGERFLYFVNPFLLILSVFFLKSIESVKVKNILGIFSILLCLFTLRADLRLTNQNSKYLRMFQSESAKHFEAIKDSKIVVIRSLYLNPIFFNNPNPHQRVFLVDEDKSFSDLIKKLKEKEEMDFTVVYPKIDMTLFDKKEIEKHNSDVPKSILPPQISEEIQFQSNDKGTSLVEIRDYRIRKSGE